MRPKAILKDLTRKLPVFVKPKPVSEVDGQAQVLVWRLSDFQPERLVEYSIFRVFAGKSEPDPLNLQKVSSTTC